jgi:hypothetical protein
MIVQKYGSPKSTSSPHTALMSDVPLDDSLELASVDIPTLGECTNDYDDT